MTLSEARKILGIAPDEDPRPHLAEFKLARERIAEMVRTAPNEAIGARYQVGLMEFDRALASVQESLEDQGLAAPPVPVTPPVKAVAKETAAPVTLPAPPPRKSRALSYLAWFFVILVGAVGGGFLYLRNEEDKKVREQIRITQLDKIGSLYVQNRRWQEAADAYREIEELSPGSEIAGIGRRSIEAGMEEEQNQYIGYWTGQAIAELEAGRINEADAAIQKITGVPRYADNAEAKSIAARIAEARLRQSRDNWLAETRAHLHASRWQEAKTTAGKILAADPADTEAKELAADADAGLAKQKADKERSVKLLADARLLDKGAFDQQAADWLREAVALDPSNTAAKELLEKFSSYTKTIRVPQDFPTPAQAIAAARGNDRIVLGELRWQGTLLINSPLVIEGTGPGKTIVQCAPTAGSAIVIGPGAKGARVSGITFSHTTMITENGDRFPAALVRGGDAQFTDCQFRDSGGHGLAVVEGGRAIASRCRFQGNTWNGAAIIGAKSNLDARDCEILENFSHGIEIWSAASATITGSRCEGNGRNGIHAGDKTGEIVITGSRLLANREFGILLGGGNKGSVMKNTVTGNLLGGIVVRGPAAAVAVKGNEVSRNLGPGLILEKGVSPAAYTGNTLTGNARNELLSGIALTQ